MQKVLDEILLSDNVVEKFYEEYEKPEFKSWLLSVMPEIEDCKNLKQDNPWHVYNCLDHILHSVEEINKQTVEHDDDTRRVLAYTMFLHDVGKPQCYIRRYSKLYKREVDSFFNHNKASVKIADRVLDDFGFNEQEKEVIKLLVEEHDIFMFITLENNGNPNHRVLSPSLLEEKVGKYNRVGDGKTLMKHLIWVGRSDNRAQNPEMTAGSLHMLDVMEDMLENLDFTELEHF